ncbi:hypothetical protein GGI07_003068 [Coemansia sp. Benny D115]|nr:hypothetical protein GGI07_003068 [Coemansia sp. Benny D115]
MRLAEQLSVAILAATAVSGWETSQMPEKIRKELCAEQVLFCTNVCGGEGLTREAFCNSNTLGSKCTCNNGAEAAIRRYQWPAFQRVCEIQRQECRNACDRSQVASSEKAVCFNGCDQRLACNSDAAPDLKIMVQKFDDPTTGSPKKVEAPKEASNGGAQVTVAINGSEKESKIKERKGPKEQKRRGGPLPTGSANAASTGAAGSSALALGALVALAGSSLF